MLGPRRIVVHPLILQRVREGSAVSLRVRARPMRVGVFLRLSYAVQRCSGATVRSAKSRPVPRLRVRAACLRRWPAAITRDVLALSKMNWNITQFDGALPIPIRAGRQVGRVLKHLPAGEHEASEYTKYM